MKDDVKISAHFLWYDHIVVNEMKGAQNKVADVWRTHKNTVKFIVRIPWENIRKI